MAGVGPAAYLPSSRGLIAALAAASMAARAAAVTMGSTTAVMALSSRGWEGESVAAAGALRGHHKLAGSGAGKIKISSQIER